MYGWTNDTTNLYVRGGTIGAGKVLTDVGGTGEATWQTPSGGGTTRENVAAGASATNLSLDVNKTFVLTNDLRTDPTYALSNLTEGVKAEIHILGQTNAANNRIVTFTAAQGGTINWQGSGTNGPSAFTVFSNATATVYLKVVTNLTQTNIIATWIQDSFWPQPMATAYTAAGGSTSNHFFNGTFYFDTIAYSGGYTNATNNLVYTNMASVMIPAHTLTNQGDSLIFDWRGRFTSARNGTNQLVAGFGQITNALGDTGSFTNVANASWRYRAEVTALGPTNHSCFWEFKLSGPSGLAASYTNLSTIAFPGGIITNGVTNIARLQCSSRGNAAITNDFFRVTYQPGVR